MKPILEYLYNKKGAIKSLILDYDNFQNYDIVLTNDGEYYLCLKDKDAIEYTCFSLRHENMVFIRVHDSHMTNYHTARDDDFKNVFVKVWRYVGSVTPKFAEISQKILNSQTKLPCYKLIWSR